MHEKYLLWRILNVFANLGEGENGAVRPEGLDVVHF